MNKLRHNLMKRSREKKYNQLLSLAKLSENSSILDVGVADREYSPVDNYFEKKYPYPSHITALSIYPLKEFSKRYPEIKAVTYNGGEFPFQDKKFSLVISNAVIEHVGDFQQQLFFINEMSRVGEQLFFTTPAKEFPIEMHTGYPFIHWLSDATFDNIVKRIGKAWASGNYMNLLTKKKLEQLLTASDVRTFKIFTHRLGLFPLHYTVWGR